MAKATTIKVGGRNEYNQGKPIGLMDIAPSLEIVYINDTDYLELAGLPMRVVVSLMKRFPPLANAFLGGERDLWKMVSVFPDAVAAIIAAGWAEGTKSEATKEMEEAASHIVLEKQIDCLAKIGGQTAVSGYGPFVEKVKTLLGRVSENGGKDQGLKSQQPSNISEEQPILKSGT